MNIKKKRIALSIHEENKNTSGAVASESALSDCLVVLKSLLTSIINVMGDIIS
jgi:hypothetical protein